MKELTESEFEEAVKRLNLKRKNEEIAKAILVDGRKVIELSNETGLTRTTIFAVLSKVRKVHQQYGRPPDGWQRVEICLPSDVVPLIQAMEIEAQKQLKQNVKKDDKE